MNNAYCRESEAPWTDGLLPMPFVVRPLCSGLPYFLPAPAELMGIRRALE